jgi:hypothetical protein
MSKWFCAGKVACCFEHCTQAARDEFQLFYSDFQTKSGVSAFLVNNGELPLNLFFSIPFIFRIPLVHVHCWPFNK